jgi:hypothetical protein
MNSKQMSDCIPVKLAVIRTGSVIAVLSIAACIAPAQDAMSDDPDSNLSTTESAVTGRPLFQMPFPCGEEWRLSTYAGHDDYEIDMIRRTGTTSGRPIVASFAGTVMASGFASGAGNRVRLYHGDGWQTEYYHMIATPIVSVGQQVQQGQVLGHVGSTGDSSGAHLHYAQRANGTSSSMGTVVRSYFNGVASDITDDARANAYFEISRNCPEAPHSITVGDLNNDGRNDLIGLTRSRDVWFSPNIGGGNGITWGTGWVVVGGTTTTSVAVGDLNNDGKNDLTFRMPNGDIWFSPNIGGGNGVTWGTGWLIVGGSAFTTITVGDLNNDGKNDLVGLTRDGDVWFSPNIGGGNGITWGTGWVVVGGTTATDVSVGDLNNDGKNDLTFRMPNGDIWFSPNLGGGNGVTWGQGWLVVGGSTATHIAVGDLNNDGRNDLTLRMPNGDIWFSPNLGGGNGITWGQGWLVVGGSAF